MRQLLGPCLKEDTILIAQMSTFLVIQDVYHVKFNLPAPYHQSSFYKEISKQHEKAPLRCAWGAGINAIFFASPHLMIYFPLLF